MVQWSKTTGLGDSESLNPDLYKIFISDNYIYEVTQIQFLSQAA